MYDWRQSLKIFGQVSRVMDQAVKDKDYQFLFLTLTIKNITGDQLVAQIDNLFSAFHNLTRRKEVKKAVKGWFRVLEISHNLDKKSKSYNTYRLHLHVVLAVNKSYFKKPELYISQKKWTKIWESCLNISNSDHNLIVDVRRFKADKKTPAKSVAETAEYTVKNSDVIIKNGEKMTEKTVCILNGALAKRRLIAFGGKLRKIHKQLNLDDVASGNLIYTDQEKIREGLDSMLEHYRWHTEYQQYIQFDSEKIKTEKLDSEYPESTKKQLKANKEGGEMSMETKIKIEIKINDHDDIKLKVKINDHDDIKLKINGKDQDQKQDQDQDQNDG